MANAEAADLMAIGAHCSVASCCQIDFLPFVCDCCSQVFCLDHRTYATHACTKSGSKVSEVIVCPICAKGIRLAPGQDPNEAWESHTADPTVCDPKNYAKVHKKPKCPVKGCKEKLSTVNKYTCKACNQTVCLKHRHGSDHACDEAQAAAKAAVQQARAASNPFSKFFGTSASSSGASSAAPSRPASSRAAAGTAGPGPYSAAAASGNAARGNGGAASMTAAALGIGLGAGRPNAAAQGCSAGGGRAAPQGQGQQQADPSNSLMGTAERRKQQYLEAQQAAQQARAASGRGGSNANPLVPPHRPEKCPQCGAAFESVARLIQHVEDFHPSAAAGASGGGRAPASPAITISSSTGYASTPTTSNPLLANPVNPTSGREEFRCHFCSQRFTDPVMLVAHSERCPAGAGGATPTSGGVAGGGGNGSSSCCLS